MAPLGVSFSLLVEEKDLVKVVLSAILDHLILISLCCALGLWHSFKTNVFCVSCIADGVFTC